MRKRATKKVMKKNRELFSMRSDFALKLGVAQRFKDEDQIYFPHNMDFRLVSLYIHTHKYVRIPLHCDGKGRSIKHALHLKHLCP